MAKSTVSENNRESTSENQRRKPIKEREFTCDGMRLSAERLIENARYEFEEFLKCASYLDLHLCYEVLNQHASMCGYLDQDDATLAQAFMNALGLPGSDSEDEENGNKSRTDVSPKARDSQKLTSEPMPASLGR